MLRGGILEPSEERTEGHVHITRGSKSLTRVSLTGLHSNHLPLPPSLYHKYPALLRRPSCLPTKGLCTCWSFNLAHSFSSPRLANSYSASSLDVSIPTSGEQPNPQPTTKSPAACSLALKLLLHCFHTACFQIMNCVKSCLKSGPSFLEHELCEVGVIRPPLLYCFSCACSHTTHRKHPTIHVCDALNIEGRYGMHKEKGMFFFCMQPDNLSHSEEPSLDLGAATDGLCDLGQVTSVLCASVSFSIVLGYAKSN